MRSLKKKAASQRGASITFALLLFLVCAVVSSVVIVAATAAGGRASQQAEMDERYYAVTAAARKLKGTFDGKEVTVTCPVKDGAADFDNATAVYSNGAASIPDILKTASIDVYKCVVLKTAVTNPAPITISDDTSKINCTINRVMKADGRLEYTISAKKTANASSSGSYTIVISFAPNLSQSATTDSTLFGKAAVKWKLLGVRKNQATIEVSTETSEG